MYVCMYVCIYIYIYIYMLLYTISNVVTHSWTKEGGDSSAPHLSTLRPIFKLSISKFGVWVKQIIKRRRWTFLVHRLIS